MDKEKIFNFYEKMYFKEIDETNVLLSRLPLLLAGVALIFNAYMFLFKMDSFNQLHVFFNVMIVAIILIPVGRLLYFLYRSFKAQSYGSIMSLAKLEEYRLNSIGDENKFKRWNEENPNDLVKEVKSDDAMWDHITKDLIKTTDINFNTNQERREWVNKAIFWMWINLCLCITIPILLIVFTSGYNYVRKETIQSPSTKASSYPTTYNNKYGKEERYK